MSTKRYWEPALVSDITLILGSSRMEDRGSRLEWSNSCDKPDVRLEQEELLMNSDRYRSRIEQLALEGVAAHHGISFAIGKWT